MKVIWIVLLVILGIILIAVGFIVFTVYQVKGLIESVDQERLQGEFEAVTNGDCSRLPVVESELQEVKGKISSACKNPLLNYIIKKKSEINVCEEAKNPNNELEQALSRAKTFCAAGQQV